MKESPTSPTGTLFLLPVGLSSAPWQTVLPNHVQHTAGTIRHYVVETAKTARAQLKHLEFPEALRDISLQELPPNAKPAELDALLEPALHGHDVGLISDAGCPAVADPGALLVARAHHHCIKVAPLVGPSSILLALMGSGLNGQSFTFHGYLPVADAERAKALRALEDDSRRHKRTQIFIETPYRNGRMLESVLATCQAMTRLCIARDLTSDDEWVYTQTVSAWRRSSTPELARRPALFLLLAE